MLDILTKEEENHTVNLSFNITNHATKEYLKENGEREGINSPSFIIYSIKKMPINKNINYLCT